MPIHLLFLTPMNNLSRRTLLILLAYLLTAIGLTIIILLNSSEEPTMEKPHQEEETKPADKLGPSELFFLDRNYPDAEPDPEIFRTKLRQAMAFDRATERTNRGLDFPWTLQGPGNIGGRVNAIAVHPTNPNRILIGYSQGGMYRTADGGQNWYPVFDDQPNLSISHISFDPTNPDKVWATTGDVNISGYPFIGAGVYQSIDGGNTWHYSGLEDTGVLSKVVVDANQPEIIYVGSMGYPSSKGNEKGLFRSVNGGATWQKTLTIDDSTGVIDLVTDPLKAGRIWASGWKRIRSSTKSSSLGPGTSLYKSEDYGATWVNVTNGLPDRVHSRTSVEITNDGTLFVSYIGDIEDGGCIGNIESLQSIYTSYDSGMTWDTIPIAPENGVYCDLHGQFGWYFEAIKVNPENPQDIVLLGVDMLRTIDGGINWFEAAPPWWTYEVHADKHDLVFAHGNMYLGTDGGAYMTDIDQLNSWTDIENIPSTQFYRTTFNPHAPDKYYGGAQDNGTSGGNAASFNEWERILGGDGFQPLFDPDEPNWIYALTQNGFIYLAEDGGFDFKKLTKGLTGSRYWDMPLVMSTQDSKILFCGSDRMFRMDMRDTLREWQEISGDLTRGDSIFGNRYPAITSIAQSPLDEMRLYAGTQDGLLWTTPDGGLTWTNITDGTPGFYVTSITCSTINPEGVIATYSGYRDNDHQPYIYRSEDAGANWDPIQADLPMMGVNSLYILPDWNDAVLFAATDGGVYLSQDAGDSWERVGSNIPYMPVYDLDYNPIENTLIAATFSRGIMTFPVDELDLVNSTQLASGALDFPVSVFPTLVRDQFTVDFSASGLVAGNVHITLMNSDGAVVHQQRFEELTDNQVQVNLDRGLAPGLYFVNIQTPSGYGISKIMVAG